MLDVEYLNVMKIENTDIKDDAWKYVMYRLTLVSSCKILILADLIWLNKIYSWLFLHDINFGLVFSVKDVCCSVSKLQAF